jgi:hypothetical protein
MKKGLVFYLILLLVSVPMLFGDTLVGKRLKVSFTTEEASFFQPRRLKMTVQNMYTKYGGYIWAEHVVDDIYDIKRDENGPFGYEVLIGTADLYSQDFKSITTKFFRQRVQKDEAVWNEQAEVLAEMFAQDVKDDHE